MMHDVKTPMHTRPESNPVAPVRRIMVGTDRSETADQAVQWAASFAERYGAELIVVQVVISHSPAVTEYGAAERTRADAAGDELAMYAKQLGGERGRALVIVDDDPAMAIVRAVRAGGDRRSRSRQCGNGRAEGVPARQHPQPHQPQRPLYRGHREHHSRPAIARAGSVDRDPKHRAPALRAPADGAGRADRGGDEQAWTEGAIRPPDEPGATGRRRQAKRLRAALEELGPTYAKLGQVLSTRPDLLPAEYIEELATLQDHVAPLTEEEVVQVTEQELGVPWEDVFDSIDPKPLAAGTIAQVHRATLASGDRVVVKVQRPTARETIEQDLALLEVFAEKVGKRPGFNQVIDMEAVFKHLSTSLRRELDFRQEAENIERMRTVLEDYDRLAVPGVHRELSTSRLLVMEEIQGGPIAQAPQGPERTQAARQLLESFYKQVLVDGFFHADPHPGNLMWWKDRIYFLDFGMVGTVAADFREQLMLLLMALWQEDAGFLTDVTLMMTGAS